MKTQALIAGTADWHAHRAQHFNASDAPAMLGCSPYKTRAQLLQELHTGLTAEVDAGTQRLFDNGHRFESLARPLAEGIIGDDLAPVVGTEGKLSASFDGLTLMGDTAFEHKTMNADLRACMKDQGNGYSLPKHYQVQMEQQLLVSGAERVLFMASEWRPAGSGASGWVLVEERHCWYASDPTLRAEIIAGWKQFAEDLANYQAPAAVEKVVAEVVEALPAPFVTVTGQIALTDNFKVFEQRLHFFLEKVLIREPKTDQDFANLDSQIKEMKAAEEALQRAEAQMLAQIQTVDQAKKTKDMLAKLVRDNRLMAEKLLASEKERRRGEIVAGGVAALKAHVDALNRRLGENYMPATAADFGGAIKGLKSLASMEDKVATTLANAKIAANETADRIQANMQALVAAGDKASFPDAAVLVLKAPEDCRAAIAARIAAEEKRLADQRERIRAEEEARATAKVRQEQEAEARRAEQAKLTHANGAPMFGQHVKENGDRLMLDDQGKRSIFCDVDEGEGLGVTVPAANVVPMPTKAPATAPMLKLGEINARLAPLSLSEVGLKELGFPAASRERNACLYHEHQFEGICDAVIAQAARAKLKQLEAA